jgi:hypothetical protein
MEKRGLQESASQSSLSFQPFLAALLVPNDTVAHLFYILSRFYTSHDLTGNSLTTAEPNVIAARLVLIFLFSAPPSNQLIFLPI